MNLCKIVTLSLLLFCGLSVAKESPEYTLKSAFIERFTRFIVWPESDTLSDPVRIGIIGDGKSFTDFKKFFKKVHIKDRPVQVLNIKEGSDLSTFDIIFVEDETVMSTKEIRKALTESGAVLTIGDEKKMAQTGIMISFYLSGSKLKFNINLDHLQSQGFTVSSFLLKMATIVTSEDEE